MHKRLVSFFIDKYKLIHNNQYGFQENHSTFIALLTILDQISPEMDSKKYSIGMFLDLSKSIDTIDHKIVLQKLQIYGVRDTALK